MICPSTVTPLKITPKLQNKAPQKGKSLTKSVVPYVSKPEYCYKKSFLGGLQRASLVTCFAHYCFNALHNYAKHVKKELVATRSEATTPTASAPKSSQQQPHSKAHTQIQQQQQYRYSVPSRQNQEEAVSKMVQNIFKLLETREYRIRICLKRSHNP